MHFKFTSLFKFQSIFLAGILMVSIFVPFNEVSAKRPPEIRNQEEIEITKDMHGRDLHGFEFIKEDLREIDFSDSDLRGVVFNNSQLQGANLNSADLEDIVSFASGFEGADLRNANLTNALLMESKFDDVLIDGADFTNAVLSRIQQKKLCSVADGINSVSGISTSYSLGC
tara:strand:+ start:2060 stop:2572 length:513 start_codon:yes stop_codon:yes gene_type:complete